MPALPNILRVELVQNIYKVVGKREFPSRYLVEQGIIDHMSLINALKSNGVIIKTGKATPITNLYRLSTRSLLLCKEITPIPGYEEAIEECCQDVSDRFLKRRKGCHKKRTHPLLKPDSCISSPATNEV